MMPTQMMLSITMSFSASTLSIMSLMIQGR